MQKSKKCLTQFLFARFLSAKYSYQHLWITSLTVVDKFILSANTDIYLWITLFTKIELSTSKVKNTVFSGIGVLISLLI